MTCGRCKNNTWHRRIHTYNYPTFLVAFVLDSKLINIKWNNYLKKTTGAFHLQLIYFTKVEKKVWGFFGDFYAMINVCLLQSACTL